MLIALFVVSIALQLFFDLVVLGLVQRQEQLSKRIELIERSLTDLAAVADDNFAKTGKNIRGISNFLTQVFDIQEDGSLGSAVPADKTGNGGFGGSGFKN